MALWAIGDLQGCCTPLRELLAQLRFNPRRDRILFTGDLVNRGPESLETLRFVKSLGRAAVTVLGNHDLHLLAAAHSGTFGARDTLADIMAAPDRDALLAWLRSRPLAYLEPRTGTLLIHAGLPPQWSRTRALSLAREAAKVIQGRSGEKFFEQMYGNEPDLWNEKLKGMARTRFVVNALTRMRYVTDAGRLEMKDKGKPGTQRTGLVPWFQAPGRRSAGHAIVCGHWSTVGQLRWPKERVSTLDSGCVWGGKLTALNLETGRSTAVSCSQYRKPGGESGD